MINFSDFLSQLLFSLFEVVAAAVILMFGWYFARVFGWYSEKYFAASKFYILFKRLPWTKSGLIGRMNWPRLIGEIAKWWLFLVFIAVCASIIGFVPVSRFLGKSLEYFVRGAGAIIILSLAALAADYIPRAGFLRVFKRAPKPLFLTQTAILVTWIVALFASGFAVKLISLGKVIDWSGAVLVVAILVALAVELNLKDRIQKLAAKAIKRFKK